MQNDDVNSPGEAEAAPGSVIKVTRRQPCPCGSGKKFKSCCEGDPRYEVVEVATEAAGTPGVHKKPPAFSPQGGGKQFSHKPTQTQQPGGKSAVHRRKV